MIIYVYMQDLTSIWEIWLPIENPVEFVILR